MKSTRARDTRDETRLRGRVRAGPLRLRRSLARSRAARFARPNRKACSQARFHVLFNSVHLKRWPQEHVHVRSVSALHNTELRSGFRS